MKTIYKLLYPLGIAFMAILLTASVVEAVQIIVPSAPGDGYLLMSSTTGAYKTLAATSTTVFYIDSNRTDSYTADGSIYRPFKTITAANTYVNAHASVTSATYNIAPGSYAEQTMTLPNIPLVVYGNQATILLLSGASVGAGTMTIPNDISFYDGVIFGNVIETDASVTNPHAFINSFVAGNFNVKGNATFSNGAIVDQNKTAFPFLSQSASSTIITQPSAVTNFNGDNLQAVIQTNGILNLNDDQIIVATSTAYAITATTTGSLIQINGLTLINSGTGGGIFMQNGATKVSPNEVSGAGITLGIGSTNAINAGTAVSYIGPYNAQTFDGTQIQATGSGLGADTFSGIISEGNVGIGTTSPYSALSVAGQVVGGNFVSTSTLSWTVKSSGGTYTTVQDAIAAAQQILRTRNTLITITVDDGTWNVPSALTVLNDQGFTITGAHTYSKSLSSIVSSSGSAGAWSIVLQLDTVTNISANDYIIIDSTSGGTLPTYMDGAFQVTSVNSGANQITVSSTHQNATPPSGAVIGTVTVLKTQLVFSGTNGFDIWEKGYLGLKNIALVGNGTLAALSVQDLSRLYVSGPVALVNWANGLLEIESGETVISGTGSEVASASSTNGFNIDSLSNISGQLIANGNTSSGLLTQNNAVVRPSGNSVFTGNGAQGIYILRGALVNTNGASSVNSTGNTTYGYYLDGSAPGGVAGTLTTSSNTLSNAGYGAVGIATTTPLSMLTVGSNASIGADYNIAAPSNGLIVEGNVGIGTNAPASKLSVTGDVGITGYLQMLNAKNAIDTTDTNSVVYGTASSGTVYPFLTAGNLILQSRPSVARDIDFVTNQAIQMVITSTGLVGIGTTSPSSLLNLSFSNSSTALTTVQNPAINLTNTNTTASNTEAISFRMADANGTEATGAKIAAVNGDHTAGAVSGDLVFLTSNAGTLTERMRILANGQMGYGTSSPNATDQWTFSGGTTNMGIWGNSASIRLQQAAGHGMRFSLVSSTGDMLQQRSTTGFASAATNMIFSNSGNAVAVGTSTTPTNNFGVSGNSEFGADWGGIAAPANGVIVEGTTGIGTSSPYAALSVQASSGDIFAVATSSTNAVAGYDSDGHRFTSGPAPTVSSCGTGSPTVAGDDQGGTITTGTSASTCTLTFSKAYQKTPYCNVSDNSLTSAADISSISTTQVQFGLSVALTGTLYYQCSYHK